MPEITEASLFASKFLRYLKPSSAVLDKCQHQVCSDVPVHPFPAGSDLVGVCQHSSLATCGLEAPESLEQIQ